MISLTKTVTYLAAVAVACLGSLTEAVEVASWMSGVKDDTPLHQLVLPGSHDTCAYDASDKTVKGWVLTQSSTLSQQLERGIRYLDLRVHTCQGTNGSKLCLYHGRYYLKKNFDSVLQDISSFFATRPSETIVIRLMVEAVTDGLDLFAGKRGQIDGFQELVERTYINQNPAMWVQTNQFGGNGMAPTQLTLGAARGKIVLLWDSGSKTSRYGYDYSIVDTRRFWEFDTHDALMNEYTRRTGISANGGWFENPTSGIVWNSEWYSWLINWLKKVPYNIDEVANKIQPRVLQELRAGRAMQKGIVSMDYPRDDVIMELISSTLRRFAK